MKGKDYSLIKYASYFVFRWIKRLMMPFKPGYLQYAIDQIFRPAGEFDERRRLHGTVQELSTG